MKKKKKVKLYRKTPTPGSHKKKARENSEEKKRNDRLLLIRENTEIIIHTRNTRIR